MKSFLFATDKNIFFFFQKLQRPWLDYVLAWPTRLGEILIVLSLFAGLILFLDRKKGLEKFPEVVLGLLGTYWASEFLKTVFHRPRPFVLWSEAHVIFNKPSTYAFPSGHAAVAFAAAHLLNSLYPGKMRWSYAVAAWISLTRIYVGVHYPTDLLGGALLGISIAALVCRILKSPTAASSISEV